jgi:hypothetical protein
MTTLCRLLPLLLTLGCAAPTEYRRGVLPSPPPSSPPLRPGVGAPIMGQPNSIRQPLPRSPGARLLPPNAEHGLWATTKPAPSALAELLGQPLPIHADDPEPEKLLAYACAHALDVGSRRDTQSADWIRSAEGPKARCMVARLQRECLAAVYEGLKDDRLDLTRYDRAAFQAVDAAFRKAHRRMNEACKGVPLSTKDLAATLAIARYGIEQVSQE